MALYVAARHETVVDTPWSSVRARQVIDEIVTAAVADFQGEKLWPIHPDLQHEYQLTQPATGLWIGAAGSIWALQRLQALNPHLPSYDFLPYLEQLRQRQAASFAEFDAKLEIPADAPGYLSGASGVNMLCWRLTHDAGVLAKLERNIDENTKNPINELMWAAPGTMLCAWFLYQETQETRWRDWFQAGVDYLFTVWHFVEDAECYAWTQQMYGCDAIHLGAVHGFAGNVLPMLKGMDLLSVSQKQQLIDRTQETLLKTAVTDARYANWLPCLGKPRPGRDEPMLQLCHGAPGVIVAGADCWHYADDAFKTLFLKAGELIWHAGPLKKPWGLCHGTAGNGYAFLKLHQLSGDEIWLERARRFAMHAIAQYEAMKNHYGCIRVDSWCGDLGLALYLQDCLDANHQFPMLDYF